MASFFVMASHYFLLYSDSRKSMDPLTITSVSISSPSSLVRNSTSDTLSWNMFSTSTAGIAAPHITVKFASMSLSPSDLSVLMRTPAGFSISSAASYSLSAYTSDLFCPFVVYADHPVPVIHLAPFPAALTWIDRKMHFLSGLACLILFAILYLGVSFRSDGSDGFTVNAVFTPAACSLSATSLPAFLFHSHSKNGSAGSTLFADHGDRLPGVDLPWPQSMITIKSFLFIPIVSQYV